MSSAYANCFPKVPSPLNIIPLGVRVSEHEFWGNSLVHVMYVYLYTLMYINIYVCTYIKNNWNHMNTIVKHCDFFHWNNVFFLTFSFFKRFYLFICRERGRGREREGNINVWLPLACPLMGTWPATQACTLTGNPTGGPLVHRPALNPLNHTSKGWNNVF